MRQSSHIPLTTAALLVIGACIFIVFLYGIVFAAFTTGVNP